MYFGDQGGSRPCTYHLAQHHEEVDRTIFITFNRITKEWYTWHPTENNHNVYTENKHTLPGQAVRVGWVGLGADNSSSLREAYMRQ